MKKFWLQSFAITLFVFFMLWAGSKVTDFKIFTAFDVVGQALKDFELTDYAFSNLRPDPEVDQRIVLVNIGNLSRAGIAQQIQIINHYKPRVIGIDSFFTCEGGLRDTLNCPQLLDTLGNLLLSNAIQEANIVVLAEKLLQTNELSQIDTDVYDSLEYSDPMFRDYAVEGFVSLPTNATYQEDVKLCRSLFPKMNVKGKEELAFSVQIAMQYDSIKTRKFLARNNKEELINFSRNVEVRQLRLNSLKNDETTTTNFGTLYYVVDVEEVLHGDVSPELFKDNIVMMGFLGEYLGEPSWDDKFFTPLNKKVAGRANPDMFGLVVHANVVSMILDETYINEIPDEVRYAVAFVVCLLTVALFILIDKKLPAWFDALSVVIQLVELLLLSFFIIQAFALWNLKMDLSIAIGVSALVGPCYDIYKSFQNEINRRLTKRREQVLTP
jgi:CHASE2 domain-containing sensor protein